MRKLSTSEPFEFWAFQNQFQYQLITSQGLDEARELRE